jgi:hypothetical protein
LFWLDVEAMTAWNSGWPEHPVMSFVEALAGGQPVRQLRHLMDCLDGQSWRLVMIAFRHAAEDRGDVVGYAFGGDPWRIYGGRLALLDWPPDELDQFDRAAPVLPLARPRVRMGAVR